MRRLHDVRLLLLFIAAFALPGCGSDRPFHRPLAGVISGRPSRPTVRLLQPVPIHRPSAPLVGQEPLQATVDEQPVRTYDDEIPVYERSGIEPLPAVEQTSPRTEPEPDLPIEVDDSLSTNEVPGVNPVIRVPGIEEPAIGETQTPSPRAPIVDVIRAEEGLPPFELPESNRRRVPRTPSGIDLPDSSQVIDGDVGTENDFPAFPLLDAASNDSGPTDFTEFGSRSESSLSAEEIEHGTMMLWKSGFGPRRVDGSDGQLLGVELKRSGKAHIDDEGRLQVSQGAYVVDGLDFDLLELAKSSGELTVELVFSPAHMKQQAPALITSFSSSHDSRNFSIGQQGANLVFQVRTSETGENGFEPPVKLARLPQHIPVHVVVSYRSGRLLCLVNGVEVHRSTHITGGFSNWEPQNLIVGDEWNHDANWNGSVEQIQIQTRALNQAQARRLFNVWSEAR